MQDQRNRPQRGGDFQTGSDPGFVFGRNQPPPLEPVLPVAGDGHHLALFQRRPRAVTQRPPLRVLYQGGIIEMGIGKEGLERHRHFGIAERSKQQNAAGQQDNRRPEDDRHAFQRVA